METLIKKLSLGRRSLRLGRKGVVAFLGFWVVLLAVGLVLLIRGPVDISNLFWVFNSIGFSLFAGADLLHETTFKLAAFMRLAALLNILIAISLVLADVYLRSGILLAAALAGAMVLVTLLVFYLQRRQGES